MIASETFDMLHPSRVPTDPWAGMSTDEIIVELLRGVEAGLRKAMPLPSVTEQMLMYEWREHEAAMAAQAGSGFILDPSPSPFCASHQRSGG